MFPCLVGQPDYVNVMYGFVSDSDRMVKQLSRNGLPHWCDYSVLNTRISEVTDSLKERGCAGLLRTSAGWIKDIDIGFITPHVAVEGNTVQCFLKSL